jgi:hypothetical protein
LPPFNERPVLGRLDWLCLGIADPGLRIFEG